MNDQNSTAIPKIWNSLEIVKLAVSSITPFILLVLSFLVWDAQRNAVERHELRLKSTQVADEADAKARERLREIRKDIYSQAAPLIRQILTYHFHVGDWKELTPADVIKLKRRLDLLVYGNEAVLSPVFADLYYKFMREAFAAAGNWHGETRLRTASECRPVPVDPDQASWRAAFTGEDNREALCSAYTKLRQNWANELLLPLPGEPLQRQCPPSYDYAGCL